MEQVFKMVTWLEKPWLAGLYLSAPYLIMLYVDLHEKRKKPRIGLTRDESLTEFIWFKDYGFEPVDENPYEARVITEGELVGYVEHGWEIVLELSDGRYVIKRQNPH